MCNKLPCMSTVRFKGDRNIKWSIFIHYTVYRWREKMCWVSKGVTGYKGWIAACRYILSQNEVLEFIQIAWTLWS